MKQNLYVFSLYRNPDLDYAINDCLRTEMAAVQAEDMSVSFVFEGDLYLWRNSHDLLTTNMFLT